MEVSASEAADFYKVSKSHLRKLAREYKIPTNKPIEGGHYKYIIYPNKELNNNKRNIIYARVSSRKQVQDLEHQINGLKEKYSNYEIISDIGSGMNYERKGFKTILQQLFKGNIQEVVVAHQDRFSRFGFEFFQWLFCEFKSILRCERMYEPKSRNEELSEDLMEIITVFTA